MISVVFIDYGSICPSISPKHKVNHPVGEAGTIKCLGFFFASIMTSMIDHPNY